MINSSNKPDNKPHTTTNNHTQQQTIAMRPLSKRNKSRDLRKTKKKDVTARMKKIMKKYQIKQKRIRHKQATRKMRIV